MNEDFDSIKEFVDFLQTDAHLINSNIMDGLSKIEIDKKKIVTELQENNVIPKITTNNTNKVPKQNNKNNSREIQLEFDFTPEKITHFETILNKIFNKLVDIEKILLTKSNINE